MSNETILPFRKELQNLGYCKTVINSYPKQIEKFLKYTRKENFEVQSKDILDYYTYLKTIISPRTKRHLSDNYLHTILLSIKLYFDYLQRTGTIKISPYQLKIKAPKSEERKVFTKEEVIKLYAKSNRLQTIILHLCYACGLRRNEATELNTKDIDLENCLLYIKKGKGKKRRVIPFTKQVQKDIEFFLSTENKTENLLNITAIRIYYEFTKLLKKTGLENKGFTLHCLRHTIATQLLEQGMELEKVRDFLGHEYLGTTQIYTRINTM
ncbi:Tyrosine recombinase XerC [Chryseobacterium aquaeductus]|uniref:Tyrosine recombinase XerC n=1 Tax=Chryseobacterium aquaeductus TaxID=2675056 RepID=A0A9N8MN78_9FLAO|nr:tyrosine-type recombinase/integrase [Chryseobacterium aquaeductus]CAA7330952.1 Tyrosine recombinase XerC [Chryseobacterium potabilaquae]CAA7330964.1 Tyrosine recombinase XerC [Chryseobacterium potabilaquae]CAD7807242.1 Tyrosine recombinase XerC [Chryseobacterium aquaeductus]CAD7807339.1 Tyrosine recombinase XerC [Chryseobacterium aquaeductus]